MEQTLCQSSVPQAKSLLSNFMDTKLKHFTISTLLALVCKKQGLSSPTEANSPASHEDALPQSAVCAAISLRSNGGPHRGRGWQCPWGCALGWTTLHHTLGPALHPVAPTASIHCAGGALRTKQQQSSSACRAAAGAWGGRRDLMRTWSME